MHSIDEIQYRLRRTDRVIADPLRFKARLEIGTGAFQTLNLRDNALQLWDVAGIALTGAKAAQSAAVATTFFSTTTGGILGFFGMASAVTPIGWVIAASVASGGAYYGVMRLMKGLDDSRVEVVPKFINEPIDVLAVGLLDLVAPLAMKIAASDGEISDEERQVIRSYFVDEWGYDEAYLDLALELYEQRLGEYTIKALTEGLRDFTRSSKDCNHRKVRRKFIELLREIATADGELHEMEELAIQHVADSLPKDPWLRLPKFRR